MTSFTRASPERAPIVESVFAAVGRLMPRTLAAIWTLVMEEWGEVPRWRVLRALQELVARGVVARVHDEYLRATPAAIAETAEGPRRGSSGWRWRARAAETAARFRQLAEARRARAAQRGSPGPRHPWRFT